MQSECSRYLIVIVDASRCHSMRMSIDLHDPEMKNPWRLHAEPALTIISAQISTLTRRHIHDQHPIKPCGRMRASHMTDKICWNGQKKNIWTRTRLAWRQSNSRGTFHSIHICIHPCVYLNLANARPAALWITIVEDYRSGSFHLCWKITIEWKMNNKRMLYHDGTIIYITYQFIKSIHECTKCNIFLFVCCCWERLKQIRLLPWLTISKHSKETITSKLLNEGKICKSGNCHLLSKK